MYNVKTSLVLTIPQIIIIQLLSSLNSTDHFGFFQVIVLVLRSTTLLFRFRLIVYFSVFSEKALINETLYATCSTQNCSNLLVNIVELLAAKKTDISARSWWRPKTERKEE